MKNQKVRLIAESAVMLALATVLSQIKIWDMPLGGSVTLLSMLPIMLIGIKNGTAWGVGTAFVYSLFQLAESLIKGKTFIYCKTFDTVIICVLFDFIVPFTVLGLCGVFKQRKKQKSAIAGSLFGISAVIIIRFVCHYITGVVIWGQWADNMSKYLYSLLYNGQYLLPELILTVTAASLLLASKPIRKLLCLTNG